MPAGPTAIPIDDARVWPVTMPLTTVFKTSNKTVTAARLVIVRLRAGGVDGWGETSVNPSFTAETPEGVSATLRTVAEQQVVGRGVDEALRAVERGGLAAQGPAVRMALSVALWDLRARLLDVPLHALLGPCHRTEVEITAHLGSFEALEDARDAAAAVDAGYPILKAKVGRTDVADDIAAVAGIHARTNGRARIYVDANQAWSRAQAATFAAEAADLGVALIEQPVAADDLAGLHELGAATTATVAADEAIHDAAGLLAAIRAGLAPRGVVVKLLKAGGITGAWEALRLADLAGIDAFVAGMPGDTSISSAALLNLCLAVPGLPLGTAITPQLSAGDVTGEPFEVVGGRLRLSQLRGPGLGIDVDERRVEALAES